jgi:nucleotidyltransferase/DNA polymerase involved in DNA repair
MKVLGDFTPLLERLSIAEAFADSPARRGGRKALDAPERLRRPLDLFTCGAMLVASISAARLGE